MKAGAFGAAGFAAAAGFGDAAGFASGGLGAGSFCSSAKHHIMTFVSEIEAQDFPIFAVAGLRPQNRFFAENFPAGLLLVRCMPAATYDTVLKSVLQSLAGLLITQLTRGRPVMPLNVEFSNIQTRLSDLVFLLADGRIFHLELQTDNDPLMPLRMLMYWLMLRRQYPNALIVQAVLYVGNARLTMQNFLDDGEVHYAYDLIDARDLDGEILLTSPDPAERVLGMLCGKPGPEEAIRRILASWAALPDRQIADLLEKLVLVSGLRGLREKVKEAIQLMAIDVEKLKLENEWFQEWKQEGLQEGRQEGLQEGRQQGLAEGLLQGQARLLNRQIVRRFGPIPDWAAKRIADAGSDQIEIWADRLLDAQSLTDIFA